MLQLSDLYDDPPILGTAAALAVSNPIPRPRQLVVETDTGKRKVGDGFSRLLVLPYLPSDEGVPVPSTGDAGKVVTVDDDEDGYQLTPLPSGGTVFARLSIATGDPNTDAIETEIPLVAADKIKGSTISGSLCAGPLLIGAGGSICQIKVETPVDLSVADVEVTVSNTACTQRLYTYFAAPLALAAGVSHYIAGTDSSWTDDATLVGADLSLDASGNFNTVAGGVFWVSVTAEITPLA